MLIRNHKMYLAPLFALALLTSGMLAGCNACNQGADDEAATSGAGTGDAGSMDPDDANGSTDRNTGGEASTMDGSTTTGAGTGTPATPAEERKFTVENMRGMRAILMTELEAVRGRLNQGGQPDETVKADQTRAGELAQGLERLDRLIIKIDEYDDVSWPTVRESSMSEAAEFRTWMAKYGMQVPS